ncbi:hypothetical protein LTS08_000657 [Lithohypha guttulata]|uniref:uncharacterized protein n=1 Tax=Lithohypha guttulata TaxID=1690604 RepID=UPI002DDE2751|nr:hypothetical protein LTR51_007018 [Lithohypha guttulata]KAK5106538.1 hypothetical protein LTS08_000657 [Lithohypha guttulata]
MSSVDELRSLASDITVGFEALLNRLGQLRKVEDDLRRQLERAVDRFNSDDSNNPSDGAFSAWQDEIVKQISCPPTNCAQPINPESLPEIVKAKEAVQLLRSKMNAVATPRRCPVPHKPVVTDEVLSSSTPRKCPVSHKQAPPAYEEMEKDFTTQGKPSSLECPFASMTKAGLLDGEVDPIAAEFHAEVLSARSLDEARGCNRCPIRFLDKHSPEEIAQYFEKHKHELPRSHEICVKRYQQNESQIRELDERYGNIVSMIQGLGNKHKQYLTSDQQETSIDAKSAEAVQQWADGVDGDANLTTAPLDPDQRLSHFNKPLRDVRVGESPTRPWGIHVPMDQSKAASAVTSNASKPPSVQPLDTASSRRQIPDPVVADGAASAQATSHISTTHNQRSNQIIFNGPVFLGYSAEQAALFLRQLGNGQRL